MISTPPVICHTLGWKSGLFGDVRRWRVTTPEAYAWREPLRGAVQSFLYVVKWCGCCDWRTRWVSSRALPPQALCSRRVDHAWARTRWWVGVVSSPPSTHWRTSSVDEYGRQFAQQRQRRQQQNRCL